MALKFGFFNSIDGDRKYNADDMTHPYDLIVSNGVIADVNGSTSFKVTYDSEKEKIVVNKGKGIFDGKWCFLNSEFYLDIPPLNVNEDFRSDRIVLRVDNENRNISIEYLTGEYFYGNRDWYIESQYPQITRTDKITDYLLADIFYAPAIGLYKDDIAVNYDNKVSIRDMRATENCGIVSNLLQNSDLSSLYEGWETNFNNFLARIESQYNDKVAQLETQYNNKISEMISKYNETLEKKDEVIEQYKNSLKSTFNDLKSEYNNWFETTKNSLGDITPLQTFSNYIVIGKSDDKYNIPINLDVFNMQSDILQVYVNGMLLAPEVEYTVNGFESITLSKAIDEGTSVLFIVLKTNGANIDPDYIEAQWEQIQGND